MREEPDDVYVDNTLFKNKREALLVYRGKELSDVTFQDLYRRGVVLGDRVRENIEAFHRFMSSLFLPARERVRDEGLVEERVKLAIQSMVQETVTNARLVDAARLRVRDVECLVL